MEYCAHLFRVCMMLLAINSGVTYSQYYIHHQCYKEDHICTARYLKCHNGTIKVIWSHIGYSDYWNQNRYNCSISNDCYRNTDAPAIYCNDRTSCSTDSCNPDLFNLQHICTGRPATNYLRINYTCIRYEEAQPSQASPVLTTSTINYQTTSMSLEPGSSDTASDNSGLRTNLPDLMTTVIMINAASNKGSDTSGMTIGLAVMAAVIVVLVISIVVILYRRKKTRKDGSDKSQMVPNAGHVDTGTCLTTDVTSQHDPDITTHSMGGSGYTSQYEYIHPDNVITGPSTTDDPDHVIADPGPPDPDILMVSVLSDPGDPDKVYEKPEVTVSVPAQGVYTGLTDDHHYVNHIIPGNYENV